MSRTFTVASTGIEQFSSTAHEINDAVDRAIANNTVPNNPTKSAFTFDLIQFVSNIQVKRVKDAVLGSLTYSIDGYLQGALSRMLADYYKHSRVDEAAPTFKSYGDFLAHIEGMTASEQSLHETGMDVTPTVERIRNLTLFRNELHNLIGNDPDMARCRFEKTVDGQYVVPTVRDMLMSPRSRSITAVQEASLREISDDDYPHDKEMADAMFEQYKCDLHNQNLTEFTFAKNKADSLVVLWACVGADDEAPVADDQDAFFFMDARTQRGMLRTALRSVQDVRKRAVVDNRLSVVEKAALRVEVKALVLGLTTELEHSVFADLAE